MPVCTTQTIVEALVGLDFAAESHLIATKRDDSRTLVDSKTLSSLHSPYQKREIGLVRESEVMRGIGVVREVEMCKSLIGRFE